MQHTENKKQKGRFKSGPKEILEIDCNIPRATEFLLEQTSA